MKQLLAATTALCLLAGGAEAALLTSTASGGGLPGVNTCNASSGTGSLSANCSGGIFSSIQINATGTPVLLSPELSATTLTVAANAPGTLTLDINQTGLASYTGGVQVTLTNNDLIGADVGPIVLSAQAPDGTTIFSMSFAGSGTVTSGVIPLSAITSDDAHFSIAFVGASATNPESVDSTIEITRVVPEPGSLALLGVGLLGLGFVASRKRSV